jgi:ABC-type transport system involved in multi-copper enzyme maturation permease subunit
MLSGYIHQRKPYLFAWMPPLVLVEDVLLQLLGLAGGTWAKIGQYLPAGLGNSLASTNQIDGVSMATAVIGIALYTVLFVGLAVLAFRRQDLTG